MSGCESEGDRGTDVRLRCHITPEAERLNAFLAAKSRHPCIHLVTGVCVHSLELDTKKDVASQSGALHYLTCM